MNKILLCVSCVTILAGCGEDKIDPKKYSGANLSAKWNVKDTCQTARMFLKEKLPKEQVNELYNSKCTVSPLSGKLIGRFSHLPAYSATWPNGASARVFVDNGSLRMMGYSSHGVPDAWSI